jgi:hypothetical protein
MLNILGILNKAATHTIGLVLSTGLDMLDAMLIERDVPPVLWIDKPERFTQPKPHTQHPQVHGNALVERESWSTGIRDSATSCATTRYSLSVNI